MRFYFKTLKPVLKWLLTKETKDGRLTVGFRPSADDAGIWSRYAQ